MASTIFANEKSKRSLSEFDFLHNPNDKNAKLGTGSFASVKLAKEKDTGKQFAIKIINMHPSKTTSSDLHNIKTEIAIHRQLDHPNIVQFHDYIHKDHNVYLILEYAESGNLYSYIHKRKSLLPEEIFRFFHQTCLAIQYLHQNDVLHRDLKPENLLLDINRNLKLCDFGWATRRITEKRTTFCGTYEYMAPEIVHKKTYDYRVDIWSLGVLLYELIHRQAPYKGRSLPEITKSLSKPQINFSPNTPSSAKDLILKILKTNPSDRLSIDQILSHPYVQSHLSPTNDDTLQVEVLASPKQIKPAKTQSISGEDLKLKPRRDNENFKSEIITTSYDGTFDEILNSKTRKNSHNHLYNSFNMPCSAKSRERSKDKTQEREKGSFINIAKTLEVQQKGPLQDLILNGSTNKTTEENLSTLRDNVKSSPVIPRKLLEKSGLDDKTARNNLDKKRKIFENDVLPQNFKSKIDNILLQVSSHTTTHKLTDRTPSLFGAKSQISAQTPSGEPAIGFKFFEENIPSSASSSSFRVRTDLESTRLNTKYSAKNNSQKKISILKTDALSILTSPVAHPTLTTRSKMNSRGSDILEHESNFALPEKFSAGDVPKTTTAKSFENVLSNTDQNKFMGSGYANETLQKKLQKEFDAKKKQILKINSENLHIPSLSERKKQNKISLIRDKENSIKIR